MKWVPVTTASRVLRLWIEESALIRRVSVNKLNKQSRRADKEWSSSLGVGRGAKKQPCKTLILRNIHKRDACSGE